MLHVTVVLEIRRLLDEGELSQRAIARRLRVSRGVVSQIAAGTRGLFGREEAPAAIGLDGATAPLPERCPGCGGMVYLPCQLCRARSFARRTPRRGGRRVA